MDFVTSTAGACGLAVLSLLVSTGHAQLDTEGGIRVAKQATARSGVQDQNSAETGFGGGGGGGIENSKYFHYQHLPEHDKYEFGYRRGNDHHVRERYEKAVPHEGHFKTKVRWADHKGGQGEHYWDYNHAGHGDDGEGGYSDPVPSYADSQNSNSNHNHRLHQKRESDLEASRRNFSPEPLSLTQSERTEPRGENSENEGFVRSFEDEMGGMHNFDIQRANSKPKPKFSSKSPVDGQKVAKPAGLQTSLPAASAKNTGPSLVFDLESGKVIDEQTGKKYLLQLISP